MVAETGSCVVNNIINDISRTVGNSGSPAIVVCREIVMKGNIAAIRSTYQTVVMEIAIWWVGVAGRLFDKAVLDSHIPGFVQIDSFIRAPAHIDMVKNEITGS